MADMLQWREKIPYSVEFQDSYYSQDGGFAEANHVYIDGVGVTEWAASGNSLHLAELGFGTGLNFLATVKVWQQYPQAGCLHYWAVEKYPLTFGQYQKAWSLFPEISENTEKNSHRLAPLMQGFQRIWWTRNIVLDVWVGDVATLLPFWQKPMDAWYCDGFAPSRNPQMFADNVLDHIQRLSHAKTRLASFTVAGNFRCNLRQRGFRVVKAPGFGRKRHCLQAFADQTITAVPKTPKSVAIIGAGIAGSCLAQQLRYLEPYRSLTVYNDAGLYSDNTASHVPLAAVAPRFSASNTPRGQATALALRYARQFYDVFTADAWHGGAGAMKLPSAAMSNARLAKAAQFWAEWGIRILPARTTTAWSGREINTESQWLDQAGMIDTKILLQKMQENVILRSTTVNSIIPEGQGWCVCSENAQQYYDLLVLACGARSVQLWPALQRFMHTKTAGLAFYPTVTPPHCALGGWGGHLLPTNDGKKPGFWYGLMREEKQLPQTIQDLGYVQLPSENIWRADKLNTHRHTPVASSVPEHPGLYMLAGAGGHGFTLMPMLAMRLAMRVVDYVSGYPDDIFGYDQAEKP